jgi:hypothetical protein
MEFIYNFAVAILEQVQKLFVVFALFIGYFLLNSSLNSSLRISEGWLLLKRHTKK